MSIRSAADRVNQRMVDRLIAEGALWSGSLIAAFRATPRAQFLDRVFQYQGKQQSWREIITRDPPPEVLRLVYSDRALITHLSPATRESLPVPISSSSQPSLMAQMLEDLRLTSGLRVLEIGAGTGYNAALLGHVVGPGLVTSIDVDRNVLSEAWDHLRKYPERNVRLKHADGRSGDPESAPFDRIMVTAATADLEPAWLEQTCEGGMILAPLALAPGLAYIVRGTVRKGVFQGRLTRAAYFMPLRAEGETGSEEDGMQQPSDVGRTVAAPWAGWFDRKKPRVTWIGFIQSLVFYALLKGLRVRYQPLPASDTAYGIDDGKSTCWFGTRKWHVGGEAGLELGWRIWRKFLNLGAPRPTEFRVTATAGGLGPSKTAGYLRQGPRCLQCWVLAQERERPAWL